MAVVTTRDDYNSIKTKTAEAKTYADSKKTPVLEDSLLFKFTPLISTAAGALIGAAVSVIKKLLVTRDQTATPVGTTTTQATESDTTINRTEVSASETDASLNSDEVTGNEGDLAANSTEAAAITSEAEAMNNGTRALETEAGALDVGTQGLEVK